MPVFLLADYEFTIDREVVDRIAMQLEPDSLPRRNCSVVVGGKVFPVKQLLAEVVELPPKSFITLDACGIFKELGYDVTFIR